MAELKNEGDIRRSGSAYSQALTGGTTAAGFAGAAHVGTGSFVSTGAPSVSAGRTTAGEEGYTLNLVNVSVRDAAKSVIGDTLGANYVVDESLTGAITIQTSAPVSRDALVDIFETALSVSGAAIVKKAGVYRIVHAGNALAGTPSISVPRVTPKGPGIKVQVIELRYISAEEMNNILGPISRQGSILRADAKRNLLVLAGTGTDLEAMREAIAVFDVDWMKGMSVALHPLKTSRPTELASELDAVFGNEASSNSKVVRFVAIERLNAILVITSRPAYLARAAEWIGKLDMQASTNEQQLFVYHIQNRPARELAEILKSVLAQRGGPSSAQTSTVAPGLTQVLVSQGGKAAGSGSGQDETSVLQDIVVADVENNALLISTTAREYERIEQILRELDVLPVQVLLEAVIAEVTLNDQLELGMRWFFENGGLKLGLSELSSGFTGATYPGFSWSYAAQNLEVTLNALSSVTDVNIISSPNLVARNNQTAILQVGDEVPIVTQQLTDTTNPGSVVNSVEMRDTGIILTVTPRVNRSGRVMLDIEQEVSSVVETASSGIDSPTIRQRKITTEVTVHDGESLALGGLIQETNSLTRSQVPLLGNIPVLGNAFKNKSDKITRTELVVFIRPRVIRSVQEARELTAEFSEKLRLQSPIANSRKGNTTMERDFFRLVY
ncbi:type II secretion system secretin GspD [Oricola sp.]|uniref:type II secretion system secretin GspD n=1 Tax=Oricola sp. TaxID=1979950 RepID=UPI0025E8CF47|nr:type II secretion system secretin GspD [Oricola sp.]MCI5075352.1 type II secretion system secretin GspD [Oricola sp.]